MSEHELPTADPLFADLTRLVLEGRCVPFIGAGMSRPTYTDWEGLTTLLCDNCGVKTRKDDHDLPFSKMRLAGMACLANRQAYFSTLRKEFRPKDPEHRHHLLAAIPFPYFLTINYDALLITALALHDKGMPPFSTYPNLFIKQTRHREVFFLHGRIDSEQPNVEPRLVLTEEEYVAAYKESSLPGFLQQLLPLQSICFLGCGLDDDYLRAIFGYCRNLCDQIRRDGHRLRTRWFMLLASDAVVPSGWDEIGVEFVRYDKQSDRHEGLSDILKYWARPPKAQLRDLSGEEGVSYASGVEVER